MKNKNMILKKSSKRNQNPSRYHDFVTNLKFQHKPNISLSKILIYKTDLIPRGLLKSLKLLYSRMNLNTTISSLPW
jgi:hypothetical protein